MPSILDQLDSYYAAKRNALHSGSITVPVSLRHPKAEEFFDSLMSRQQDDTANGNHNTHRHNHTKHQTAYQSSLISA